MANTNEISINTGKKTVGDFTVEYQRNGYGGVIPVIDGVPQPSLMFGYASESDRNACMRLLEDAIRASGGSIPAIQQYIMTAVTTAANEIHPDEAVEIDDVEILLSYRDRKAYLGTAEIANLSDIPCELPYEAIKAMLTDRARIALSDIDNDDEEEIW